MNDKNFGIAIHYLQKKSSVRPASYGDEFSILSNVFERLQDEDKKRGIDRIKRKLINVMIDGGYTVDEIMRVTAASPALLADIITIAKTEEDSEKKSENEIIDLRFSCASGKRFGYMYAKE